MNFERGFSRCSFRFRYTKHWSIACNDKKNGDSKMGGTFRYPSSDSLGISVVVFS